MIGVREARRSGPPRILKVRHEPPTIEEAVAVAQDLADRTDYQVRIIAGLMGISANEAQAHVAEAGPKRSVRKFTAATLPQRGQLIVERKTSRLGAVRRSLG